MLNLSLEHEGKGINEDKMSDLLEDIILVLEKHNFTCGGGIKPVDEDGEDIDPANYESGNDLI